MGIDEVHVWQNERAAETARPVELMRMQGNRNQSLEADAAQAAKACQDALLAAKYADWAELLAARVEGAPQNPDQWFALMSNYWTDAAARDLLSRMKQAITAEAKFGGGRLEHYAALQALIVAASKVDALQLNLALRRNFTEMCFEIARLDPQWADHFDIEGPRFWDITRLATLHRFIAGELAFELRDRIPLNFLFRVHPAAQWGFLCQTLLAMQGAAPVLWLHLNYARKNTLVVAQIEFERALWRMAKVLEQTPHVKGIAGNSWFNSVVVGEMFPRLAWMRRIYIDAGAYAVDLEPADATWIGYNSAKRRRLYEEGKFLPRNTAILWPRDRVLAWAASRPELADPGIEPINAPDHLLSRSVKLPPPAPARRSNSPIKLWDGLGAVQKYGMKYWAGLFMAPSLLAACATGMIISPLAALPALFLTAYLIYVFQYYFSQ